MMTDGDGILRTPGPRGCLGSAAGLVVLAMVSPFALLVRGWRRWRRGDEVRVELEMEDWPGVAGRQYNRIDVTMDAPLRDERVFRRRVTDAVIRVAEALRRPDDAYTMISRTQSDLEASILPVGPQLQELGERFFLVLNQESLSGTTVVWLTLDRRMAPAEVVDPAGCDPEGEGEPDGLLGTSAARWAMASEWARVGPSLLIRLVLVVPSTSSEAVCDRLRALEVTRYR